MRSESVVLPESMWALIPMLLMKSMFATSVSALLDFSVEQAAREREFPGAPRARSRAPYPEWGEMASRRRSVHFAPLAARRDDMPHGAARCAAVHCGTSREIELAGGREHAGRRRTTAA